MVSKANMKTYKLIQLIMQTSKIKQIKIFIKILKMSQSMIKATVTKGNQ